MNDVVLDFLDGVRDRVNVLRNAGEISRHTASQIRECVIDASIARLKLLVEGQERPRS